MPKKQPREFDFSKVTFRKVALRLCYLGWDYDGFCVQETSTKTIEHELFQALLKTKLIANREESDYHRCGRTDKGVSSSGQVVSLMVRSQLTSDEITSGQTEDDLNYPLLLNRVLPQEIRVLAWAPVEQGFSARFDCGARIYRYYFPKGKLNIAAMQAACSFLVGQHDFRNFCKMDVSNGVTEFVRTVTEAGVKTCEAGASGFEKCVFEITSKAFLWHQIRCILAVLVAVGEEDEEPSVVRHLLDVTSQSAKPQYTMAADYPLNLYDCVFERNLDWRIDDFTRRKVQQHFQRVWAGLQTKSWIVRDFLDKIAPETEIERNCGVEPVLAQATDLIPGSKPKVYKRLLDRPRCDDLQKKMMKFSTRELAKNGGDEIPD